MDFLLNIFSEQLSKFVNGFRKEQVTTSLLTGKGEITDIHVNVETINAILKETTPLVELSSVYVSKLSFNVTSFTNLKKKPIEVSIDEIHILIVEPLSYNETSYDRDEWNKKIVADALKRGSYGLLDRIGDNITLEVNRIYITFQPMGKFKTRRIGPWTPPAISIVLNNFKYVSVDEYGQEGPSSAIWGHTSRGSRESQNSQPNNHYINRERVSTHRTLIIYKKASMDCSIAIGYMREGMNVQETFKSSYLLLRNVPIEVHIALHRRISNAAILAVQIDGSLETIDIEMEADFFPTLFHAVSGMKYCLGKDRPFIDPLVCNEKHENKLRKKNAPTVQLVETEPVQTETIAEGINSQDDDFTSDAESEDNDITQDDIEDEDINVSSTEQKPSAYVASTISTNEPAPNSSQTKNKKAGFNFQKTGNSDNWPAIILPFGILIFEKVCFSVSVHSAALQLRYNSNVEGYVKLSMKGMVGEIIWPQYEEEQGGIVQLSLAYLCLQECNSKSIRTLLIGGTEHDWFKSPSQNETSYEEYFPLLEPRPVRNDPLDYRSTFPLQTFGFKASIRVLKEAQTTNVGSRIFVLNEVGINGIEIVFDSNRWGRLSSFYSPEGDSKYDHRWFSGDWNSDITEDMLISPSTIFDYKKYVQPRLDKDEVKKKLSSDLINLTAKLTSIKVRIPAPLHEDVDSSDVCISFSESMVLISSALPRNFLPENIPGKNGDVNENLNLNTDDTATLQFPNGLSDLSYDHLHTNADHNIRTQIILDNFSIVAIPPIPFSKSNESLTIASSSKLTLLLSLEKEDRKPRDIDDLTTLIFFSALFHDIEVNAELGVVSSITGTILYHIEQLSQTLAPYTSAFAIDGEMEHSNFIIFTRLSIVKFDFFLWRHSVSVASSQAISDLHYQNYVRLLLLMHSHMESIDAGLQLIERDSTNKLQNRKNDTEDHRVLKASIGKICLSLCDFDALRKQMDKTNEKSLIIRDIDDSQGCFKKCVDIICFEKGKGALQPSIASERNIVFATRVESRASFESPCYSAAIEISTGEVELKMKTIDSFVTLMTEALFEQVSQLNFSKKIMTWRNTSIISQIIPHLSPLSRMYNVETAGSGTLQEKINSFLPVTADFILMRLCIENVIVVVPRSPTSDDYFGLLFEATSLCVGSFRQRDFSSDKKLMLKTVLDESGNQFRIQSDGLYHAISSRQKCIKINQRRNKNAAAEVIIDSFTLESNYQPIKWQGLLSDCNLTIHDLTVLDELSSCLKSCSKYSARIQSEVSGVLSTLASIPYNVCATKGVSKTVARNGPLIAICQASSDSMKSTTFLFAQMKDELAAFDKKNRLHLEVKQNEIDNLRSLVFKKERDCLSISSLVSNQACGFIRMGGTGLSGQRTVSVTNLWKYWAVLRDSHLIIFKDFSKLAPVDYIFMQGAKLRALAGADRKRDLKLGFVIIDSSNKKRFFLAPTNTDYQMWVHSLSLVIRNLSGEDTRTRTKIAETKAKEEIINTGVQSPLLLGAKDGAILKETYSSTDVLGTPSQNTNDHPLKVRSSSIDTLGTSSRNSNESKKKSVKIKLGDAVHSVFRQKISDSLNIEDTNCRQTSQKTTDSEHALPVQAVECDNSVSNYGNDVVSVEDDSASYESAALDERSEGSPKRKSKLLLGMSKLGSAVKNVKITDRKPFFPKAQPSRKSDHNSENTHSRQASQKTADSEHTPPVQAVECDDLVSNHGNALVLAEDDNASYASASLDDRSEENSKHQSKLRLRMSKLGSVVKSVKIADRNTLFPKAPSGRKGEVNDDLHRSQRSSQEKPLKMTSLRPDVYEPPTKDLLLSKKPQIVKRVEGVWDVKVDYGFKSNLNGATISPSGVIDENLAIESTKLPEAPSESSKTFRIILMCLQLSESENPSKVTIIKTFSDIVDFHSRISETLYSTEHNFLAENMNLAEDKAYRDALKNQVITCGNILQGLIEYPDRSNEYLLQCVSDSLATFIACLLSNCLPENAYDIVVEFLKLRRSIVDISPPDDVAHHSFEDVLKNKSEGIILPSKYMHLINKCESELIKSNYQILKAKILASTPDQSHSTEATQMKPRMNSASLSNVYNKAMQEALAAVMAERDEAYVQLLASRVIHSHEIEQERKRGFVLQKKVEHAERFCNADSSAAKFFLGQEVSGKDSLGKIEKEMVQDTDEELLALCRQLSSEISLRVAAELEILRLKERRKIEHDNEVTERALLRDEVQHNRKQLEEEIQRRKIAEDDKRRWEQSFKQIINNPDASV